MNESSRGAVIESRLRAIVRQRVAWDSVALAMFSLAMAGALLLLVVSLFWSGWVMMALLVPVGLLVWRLVTQNRFWHVARLVEERFPEVRERLVAAWQLAQWNRGSGAQGFKGSEGKEGYSEEMIDAVVADVEQALTPLPLARLVNRWRPVWAGAALFLIAIGVGVVTRVSPARFQTGIVNAFQPQDLLASFAIQPGDTAVMPGGSVVLRARVSPAGVFSSVRLVRAGRERDSRVLKLVGDTCRIALAAGHGFEYRFSVLRRSSDAHRVRVLEPLSLERLVFTLHPPVYSGLPETKLSGTEVSGLKGTVVDVEGEANRLVSDGRLVLGSDTVPLQIDAADSGTFKSEFTIKDDAAGTIELADNDDKVLQSAADVQVQVIADEPPFVKLYLPGRDVDLPVSMKVLLGINSIDDFGLGELYLHYGRDSIDQRVSLKSLSGRREDTTLYAWDLSNVGLLPGEAIHYYVSVTDNDAVSGPKASRTEVYTVRFPTMNQIYNAAVQQTEHTESELGPMQSQQAQLGEELSRLADDMKKSRELSWDEKQALGKVLGGQQGLMQQVEDLKQEVSNMMNEMSQGMALDQQTMERMDQLQQLLSQILPRELQQSLAQLQDKLEQQSPDVRRALDKFQLDQDKMKQSIDRALDLLKKIMEEQRLEALAKKADELAKAQHDLTDKLGKEPGQRSAQVEQDVKGALDSLQSDMKSLADSMSDKETGDSLTKLAQQADDEKLSEQAQDLANQMQQEPDQAKPGSTKLGQSLMKLSQSLSSLSKRLKANRSAEVTRKLQDAAQDVLMVSDEQEKLEQAAAGMADMSEHARQEMGLHEAARIVAESLASLSSSSMSVDPSLGQELAKATDAMDQAAQGMADNRGGVAQPSMEQARQSLNRTAEGLLQAMAESQKGGGMSSGMDGLMQQLSQMTAEQMSINAGMSGFPIPMPGGMSAAQMAALSRMLGQEQALREQLEQMLQQMGGTQPGLTSSLEGLLDDLKAVEKDLSALNVNRQLVQRQESILSHLLDAQRSIQQQGFKDERESEAGKELELQGRPRLPEDKGERNRLLREELMRSLKEGYPAEYEQMIRDYFQRLINE